MVKTTPESAKKLVESAINDLKNEIIEEVTKQLGTHQKSVDMQLKSIFSTMEVIQQMNTMLEKQINYKMGSFEGKIKARTKEQLIATDLSAEEALNVANKIREEQGLPPLVMPKLSSSP